MEWLKIFSEDYSDGVTAIAAIGALLLSGATLYFLRREFVAKFQPFVVPVVEAKKSHNDNSVIVSIIPRNVGSHSCYFKLLEIKLHIGDESYDTPSFNNWMLLPPQGVGLVYPAGYINNTGVEKIRNNNYRRNRIELSFKLQTKSMHHQFEKIETAVFEINVMADEPQALSRPDWIN